MTKRHSTGYVNMVKLLHHSIFDARVDMSYTSPHSWPFETLWYHPNQTWKSMEILETFSLLHDSVLRHRRKYSSILTQIYIQE